MKRALIIALFTVLAVNASNMCGTVPEHQTLELTCPGGKIINAITYASYGTPNGGCASPSNSACHATTSQSVLEDRCLGNPSCSVAASNGVFGDPCRGTFKRLTVQFTCVEPTPFDFGNDCEGDCAIVEEHQDLTVSCGTDTISAVLFASYGKPQGLCSSGFTEGACHATTSQSVVEAACVGQTSCTISAENRVFGDPCRGTFKDLAVIVQCDCPPQYSCSDYPTWNGATAYAEGDLVTFGGIIFEARQANTCKSTADRDFWRVFFRCEADCSSLMNWEDDKAYFGGNSITYGGAAWVANWYSLNSQPVSEPYKPWRRVGFCDSRNRDRTDCNSYFRWRDNQIYDVAGTRVVYGGRLYENRWWTRGNNPRDTYVWNTVGRCQQPYTPERVDCSGEERWQEDVAYSQDAQVRHGGRLFVARWYTLGDQPRQDGGVWREVNYCE